MLISHIFFRDSIYQMFLSWANYSQSTAGARLRPLHPCQTQVSRFAVVERGACVSPTALGCGPEHGNCLCRAGKEPSPPVPETGTYTL